MISYLLDRLVNLYIIVIFVYVILSWFPRSPFIEKAESALGVVCEPYLGLFRRIIPPIGMIDVSPIVAVVVLEIVVNLIVRLLGGL